MEPIMLGTIVSDHICNFTGVAVARTVYLNGCVRIEVQPKELKEDGSMAETEWFDENQLAQLNRPTPEAPHQALENLDDGLGSRLVEPEVTGGPDRSIAPSRDP